MTKILDDEDVYLTPEEFADNLVAKKEFVAVIWDSSKYRLGQRLKYLMLKGYEPLGGMVPHDMFEDMGTVRVVTKSQLCVLVFNKAIYKKIMIDNGQVSKP